VNHEAGMKASATLKRKGSLYSCGRQAEREGYKKSNGLTPEGVSYRGTTSRYTDNDS
jgi:hypothetical protein